MNEQVLERPAPPIRTAAPTPRVPERTAPTVFRRQERFWKEIRQHITERNPRVRDLIERLY